jgi:hypothetical protein
VSYGREAKMRIERIKQRGEGQVLQSHIGPLRLLALVKTIVVWG